MYCSSCGTELTISAAYCPACGKLLRHIGESYSQAKSDGTPRHRKGLVLGTLLTLALLALAFLKYAGESSGRSPQDLAHTQEERADEPSESRAVPKPLKTPIEIDVTKLGLRRKTEVKEILGPPSEDVSGEQQQYGWGSIYFKGGRLDQIDYGYKEKPSSVKEALEKVGLEQTSPPKKGPFSYYWNSSTGPLICCGFEMDNVVISEDFSGIMVGFKKRSMLAPERFSKSSVSETATRAGTDALLETCSMGNILAVRKLLDTNADVNGTDSGGWTPLMKATVNGHTEIVKLLLARGADVNARAANNHTALMSVTKNGAGIAQILLAAGADPNAQRTDGITPLMIAVLNESNSVVGALLKRGADPSRRVTSEAAGGMFTGWTAEDFANWKQDAAMARLLHHKTSSLVSASQ